MGRFIDVTLENRIERMLENADAPSERVIAGDDWQELFGME